MTEQHVVEDSRDEKSTEDGWEKLMGSDIMMKVGFARRAPIPSIYRNRGM